MNLAKYLSNILLGQSSDMINDLIFVILPVLSITVLMFSLRSFFEGSLNPKLKKQ
tara:strand:- start:202 stop:366 length:165 start_codon:yes stop_codon:yes gene_type:complete